MATAPATAVAPSTPSAPSAAVTALNAQRQAAVDAGQSAYAGTKANLATFTSANPSISPSQPASTPGSSPANPIIPGVSQNTTPTIVTSNASRSNYADNVTALNGRLSTIATPGDTSVVDYLNKSGMPSDYATRSTMAAQNGITGYTGTAAQNLQLLSALQTKDNDSSNTSTPTAATPVTPTTTTPATTAATPTTNTDGSTTNTDGTVTNADGSTTDPNDITSGLPPAFAAEYKGVLQDQENAITTAQSNLDAARATLTNDPAASAAAATIASQYGVLITAMQQKNQQVLGRAQSGEAAFGGLGVMPQTFMSDEMDAASTRIADLVSKEQEATLKSNTAYQNNDLKAFNASQTALTKATTDKTNTIAKLLTATNDQVKLVQSQQKADAAATKAALTSDVTTSSKIAAVMAQALSESGVTDPDQVKAYVQAMATKNGITNTDILQSALVTAQAANTKANLAAENTNSEIEKRGTTGTAKTKAASTKGSGTDGSFNYSASDVAQYSNLLNEGGTAPDGTKFNARGADGYVDPSSYTAAYTDWVKNGGTPAGFAKKFPVKTNVNPSSYSGLPAAIQPTKATASTAAAYPA